MEICRPIFVIKDVSSEGLSLTDTIPAPCKCARDGAYSPLPLGLPKIRMLMRKLVANSRTGSLVLLLKATLSLEMQTNEEAENGRHWSYASQSMSGN